MAKQINNWNTAEGSLSVSLYKNPFTGNGYVGKVKRRNVALDTLIGMIATKNPGVSAEVSYSIAVRTMFSSSSTTRKSAVTGYSSSVTVKDAD
ncbi:MAG: hypothetical protein IJ558_06730 [Treponema sp.]|nr:hypothetical protein [Treponema sp.]